MRAVLSRVFVFKWRSRQFTVTLSWPSSNQVCSTIFADVFQIYLRPLVGDLNQSSVAACSSQNPSGSLIECSYIFWYCPALMKARWTTSRPGGNVRPSCMRELVEMGWETGWVNVVITWFGLVWCVRRWGATGWTPWWF